jgi:transposase-like protein
MKAMKIKCLKCGSENYVKNGVVFGIQRYKCKDCGYQYTKLGPHGKPANVWMTCHGLYAFGLSMRQIAHVIGVSAQTVSRWIKKWHHLYMHEMGEKQILYSATKENLADCLNLQAKDKLLVSSSHLPSGAEIYVVVKLPKNHH